MFFVSDTWWQFVGDDNDPDDDTAVSIEGVWTDDKVIDVCKAELDMVHLFVN